MIKRMKRMNKKVLILLIPIILLLVVFLCVFTHYYNSNNIDKVLESSAYNYLPKEAKNYIKSVYEETGEILLTEKNKKENEEYLNPAYVDYLTLTDVEKSEEELIPDSLITDYVYNKNQVSKNTNLPSSFDLRNVDGKNFVTPLKNQGNLGICWAFASIAQAESYLLINENKTVDENSKIFSERQIDYATAKDGLIDSDGWYKYDRALGGGMIGGSFRYFSNVVMDGLGFADITWKEYNATDFEKMEMNQVYNFSNSNYELDGAAVVPKLDLGDLDLTQEEDVNKRNEYLNKVKSLIMQNGGAYVSTKTQNGYCSVATDSLRLIYNDGLCNSGNHAMQIIGWDDDVEYSFCSGKKRSDSYYLDRDVSSCDTGTVVKGKGVWLLKNSSGNSLPYLYLAYDSKETSINIITKISEKSWDNYYSYFGENYGINVYLNRTHTFSKKTPYDEQIHKIKTFLSKQNKKYDLYISEDGNAENFKLIDSITTDLPGIYTFDLLDKNIVLHNSNFLVKIIGAYASNVSVYTDNLTDNYSIKTYDSTFENSTITNKNIYSLRIESDTSGIDDNTTIDYKLYDSNNNEIDSNYYSYSENVVFANKIYSKLLIDSKIDKGVYTLHTIYNGQVSSVSNVILDKDIITIDGSGTENDPYLIGTSDQLNLVRLDAYAYYKLIDDIDLSHDTFDSDGKFYNNGKGWEPLTYSHSVYLGGFSGVFDGNGHTISGLYINRPDEDNVGLFRSTYNENYSDLTIKDLHLKKVNITGKNYVGSVIGYAYGASSSKKIKLYNLSVESGIVNGNNYVGGVIGYLFAGSNINFDGKRHVFNRLYNAATITANDYAGGIIGLVSNLQYYGAKVPIEIYDIENLGTVISDNDAGGLFGHVKMQEDNSITVGNVINMGRVLGNNSYAITPAIDSKSFGSLTLENIYYINDKGFVGNDKITANNVLRKSISELKNENNYTSWNEFVPRWSLKTINNISRIPILSDVHFQYTEDIDDIQLFINSTIDIKNYINPKNDLAYRVNYSIEDDAIARISDDGLLTALKEGTTHLTFLSSYDGYEKTVAITVVDNTYTVKFDGNGGTGNMKNQSISVDSDSKLNKNSFVKKNYNFKEWNTKSDGTGISYQDEESIYNIGNLKDVIVLYAMWEAGEYTVYFDGNGASGSMEEQVLKIDKEKNLVENTFIRENYKFREWNTKSDGTGVSYSNKQSIINLAAMNEKIVLYAIWDRMTYTVWFDPNDGTGNMKNQIINVNEETRLSTNPFTKEGFVFKCWNTMSDGTGVSYSNKQLVENIASDGEQVVLYALWATDIFDLNEYSKINNYIKNISENTKLDDYYKDFHVLPDYEIKVYNHVNEELESDAIITTGTVLKVFYENEVVDEYINVVKGDVNGDGAVSVTDISKLFRHIISDDYKIEEAYYLEAGDVNNDGSVTITDISKLFAYIIKNIIKL